MPTRVDAWLAAAVEDAERRGLPELKPLLEALARSTTALRVADEKTSISPGATSKPLDTTVEQ